MQVAEALEYANRQGVLHRDVKPSNLLLDSRGNVWVADFGLAKTAEADDLTHTGDILGTIRYMAPERFSGHCDARSDVYSLGLTLYELVALRPAFQATDRHALIDRVRHGEPDRLKKVVPGVPRDLETIIAKAIARDPSARYATAGALAEDLQRFVEDRPIRARRVSASERLVRWCRRNPWIAGSIGVAASATVGLFVLALVYAADRDRFAKQQTIRVAEQTKATNEITRLAGALERRGKALESSLAESTRRLAMLDFEHGRIACEQGQIGPGLVWMIESLRTATDAGDPAWRHAALASLSDWRRYHTDLKGIFTHQGAVAAVAMSPDGAMVLTGSYDKTAQLWNAATGQPIGRPLSHERRIVAVAFSPDGKTVATGSYDKTARLWDASTGQPIGEPLPHHAEVLALAFSPDGKAILSGCWDQTARLWDVDTGQPTGKPLSHQSGVAAVAFSPDGKSIVTGCQDRTARLWDAGTGQPVAKPMEHPDAVVAVAFSPDGKTILTGCRDGKARLWDADTGRLFGQPMEHSGWVLSVAFSPDGKTAVTGSSDRTARLWDADTGRPIGHPLPQSGEVVVVEFSPDGKTVITVDQVGMTRLWDPATGRPVGSSSAGSEEAATVTLSPDHRTLLIVSEDGTLRRWDAATGRPVGSPLPYHGVVMDVALSFDGKRILTGGYDKTARLWDAATGRPLGPQLRHSAAVESVAFSPDDKTILTGSQDGTARLWDAATGQPIARPLEHRDMVVSVAFSPDGQTILTSDKSILASNPRGTVRLWETPKPVPDDLPRLTAWVTTSTGLELDEQGAIRVLDGDTWWRRRVQLRELGGPPAAGPAQSLDPILLGLDPTARARAWNPAQPLGGGRSRPRRGRCRATTEPRRSDRARSVLPGPCTAGKGRLQLRRGCLARSGRPRRPT